MIDRDDKKRLSAEYAHLRREESQAAPPFQPLIESSERGMGKPIFGRQWVYAFSAVAALALTIFLMKVQGPDSPQQLTTQNGIEMTGLKLDIAHEMPTDFLLETPWFSLEDSTPNFELTIPDYQYREE